MFLGATFYKVVWNSLEKVCLKALLQMIYTQALFSPFSLLIQHRWQRHRGLGLELLNSNKGIIRDSSDINLDLFTPRFTIGISKILLECTGTFA